MKGGASCPCLQARLTQSPCPSSRPGMHFLSAHGWAQNNCQDFPRPTGPSQLDLPLCPRPPPNTSPRPLDLVFTWSRLIRVQSGPNQVGGEVFWGDRGQRRRSGWLWVPQKSWHNCRNIPLKLKSALWSSKLLPNFFWQGPCLLTRKCFYRPRNPEKLKDAKKVAQKWLLGLRRKWLKSY